MSETKLPSWDNGTVLLLRSDTLCHLAAVERLYVKETEPSKLGDYLIMDRQPHPQRKYEPSSIWYVYIVRCRDSSYYTGITTDLTRRLAEHNSVHGGARYTRPRRPVTLIYYETASSRSAASRREYQIKQLTVHGKNSLVRQKKS